MPMTMVNDVSWNILGGLLAGWLLMYTLHSTILLTLAWLLTRRGIFSSPQTADILWKIAMVGGLITASVQTLAVLGIVPFGEHLNIAGIPATGLFREIRNTTHVPTQSDQF